MDEIELCRILTTAKTVAVIGVSSKSDRASHQVAAYLIEQTHFEVFLINPAATENILGQKVYKSLADLPLVPDIIDVFRKGEDMPAVFEKEFPAISSQATGKTWWMQLGIENQAVAEMAKDAGQDNQVQRYLKNEVVKLIQDLKI